jgi:hypothetical protein
VAALASKDAVEGAFGSDGSALALAGGDAPLPGDGAERGATTCISTDARVPGNVGVIIEECP